MNMTETLREWRRRSSARRELASLDARHLRDTGISSAHAAWEARRPFWKPLSDLR